MTEPFLNVSNLTVTFPSQQGPVHAVRDLSFTMQRGKTLAIVGESGCGKSTICHTLLGLHPQGTQVSGSILLQKEELIGSSEKQWTQRRGRQIAMIFQDPMTSLNPTMRIGDQIIEGLVEHGIANKTEAKKRAIKLLHEVGIPDPKNRFFAYPHTFSGGMRQRVVIAIALACDPVLLIADEPTTALDVTIQAQIMALLNTLQKEHALSILLISHDLAVVADTADEVIVMYGGKGVEYAPTKTLFDNPTHPYSSALIRSLPTIQTERSQLLYTIEGRPPSLTSPPSGCPFWPRCSSAMQICKTPPPLIKHQEEQQSACWLHHPLAKAQS